MLIFLLRIDHMEWFELLKKKELIARIVTHKEAAISQDILFPKNRSEYDLAFPWRVIRHHGQPRTTEIFHDVELKESLQSIRTFIFI